MASRRRGPLGCPPDALDSSVGDTVIKPHRFETKRGETVEAEWGSFTVPENRRAAISRPLTLAFVRFPSTSKSPGDPIVFLAGGPGESGIDVAHGQHFRLFMALREAADVVVLDQRGTGASRPAIRCDEKWTLPLGRPTARAELLAAALKRSRACADSLRAAGADLDGYNTVESADDVDALRAALGAEKIHLLGASYGTHLGFTVLRRHGDRVGRCVFGGAEGPDHSYKLPSIVERYLGRVGEMVRRDPAWGKRFPDFAGTMGDTLARLERHPVSIEVPDPESGKRVTVGIGRFDVEYITAAGLADTRLLAFLPQWYAGMSRGDFTLFATVPILTRYLLHLKRGLGGNAMGLLTDCASGVTRDRWQRIEREAAETTLGRTIDFPFPEICPAWGCRDLGDDFRSPFAAPNPLLFFSGSFDCRTPLENVTEVRSWLSDSRCVEVEGAGHFDTFLSAPGGARLMTSFFSGHDVDSQRLKTTPAFQFEAPQS
jgi:pimeloyl-ACP methyl ester carboxylesterase